MRKIQSALLLLVWTLSVPAADGEFIYSARDPGASRGVRLGPSGNYGEFQYAAGGNWSYKWQKSSTSTSARGPSDRYSPHLSKSMLVTSVVECF